MPNKKYNFFQNKDIRNLVIISDLMSETFEFYF